MAHRVFTPRQQAQNAAFLAALRRTGNARLAARELGVNRSTYTKRRARCAAFATLWDMAVLAAHASFRLAGGERAPAAAQPSARDCPHSPPDLKTKGGEPTIVRLPGGRLQLRLAPPGRLTEAGEQHYLAALSVSANIRLSARATGFAHSTFYRRRERVAAFAREERLSLDIALDRLNLALSHSAHQAFAPAWRAAPDAYALPAMTVGECLHLVTMHQNAERRGDRARRRARAWDEAGVEARAAAAERAACYRATGSWRLPAEPAEAPKLPPLDQVSGWSKAPAVKVTYHPGVPLFGGWRIGDWDKQKKAG